MSHVQPTSLEELLSIEAIKQLKARYFRLMDTRDWDGFAQVFTEDIVVDVSEDAHAPGDSILGRNDVVKFIEGAVGKARTIHHGHMPEITIHSADRASGIWAMYDFVEFETPKGPRGIRGYGHYHEEYRKFDGHWRIAKLNLTRLRVDRI